MDTALSLVISGFLLWPGAGPAPAPATGTATADDAPVAVVDGEKLTKAAYKEFLFQQFGSGYLDVFINERILAAHGKAQGVVVSDEDARLWIEEQIKLAGGMPELQGLDPDELRRQYQPHARTGCLIERLVKRRRLSDEGLKREYELRYGEKRRARHILIRTGSGAQGAEEESPEPEEHPVSPAALEQARKKAEEVHEALAKGADFAALARKESQDPVTAGSGGELPEFSKTDMVPEFSEVAFALKEPEISKPVKSRFGYHIIQVTKIVPPARALDEKLAAELREEVGKRPLDREEVSRFLTEIRGQAKVERLIE